MPPVDRIAELRADAGCEPAKLGNPNELVSFTLRPSGDLDCVMADGTTVSVVALANLRHGEQVAGAVTSEQLLLQLLQRVPSHRAVADVPMFARRRNVCGESIVEYVEAGRG